MHSDDATMSQSEYNNREKLHGQFEILGSNELYEVVAPNTFAAERYFGSNTEWCTVGSKSYFDDYMRSGHLYILYPKNGDNELKMQFHIESESYATYADDVYDSPKECICALFDGDEDVIISTLELCKQVFGNKLGNLRYIRCSEAQWLLDRGGKPKDVFDWVGSFQDGYARVELNGKSSFIDTNCGLIGNGKLWFDDTDNFYNGFAIVQLGNKYTFIDTNGRLIGDGNQLFDYVFDFVNGFARVGLNGKYSYIDTNGKLIGDGKQWFDKVYNFKNENGFAIVGVDGKESLIDTNGKLIGDGKLWFDKVYNFIDGYAQVELHNKCSFIDGKTLHLIGDGKLWFDLAGNFVNGFARVKINDKWSYIDSKTGKLIGNGNQWFNTTSDFCNDGFALVDLLNDKWYYLNTNGNLFNTPEEAQQDNQKHY